MSLNLLKLLLVLLLMDLEVNCESKGSLSFVIDITGSMYDDITETIEASQKVLKMAIENNSSVIENFVLISFGDPEVTTEIITTNPEELSYALEGLLPRVGGGGDCPEMSLSGIETALEVSQPGSFLYVFTDAVAKDFQKVEKVNLLAQKRQSRVIFLLTGTCDQDRDSIEYQVYQQIAAITSGQVFHLLKSEVSKVLETIPNLIIGRSSVLTSQLFSDGCNLVNFTVDSKTKEVTISASGENIAFGTLSSSTKKYITETLLHTNNIIILRISYPLPGDYSLNICSDSMATVVVNGRTDFDFKHGFSIAKPKSIRDTSIQPVAGVRCHLAIDLTNPENDVELKAVEVLSINELVLFEVPVHFENKDFYVSDHITPPNETFKIAIKGIDKNNGSPVRRISKTAIEPIRSKKPVNYDPDLNFSVGFSPELPKVFEEYSEEPIKGIPCHLAINLINSVTDAELTGAEILDLYDNVLLEVPLFSLFNALYATDVITPPEDTFKVAIKGVNRHDGSLFRKINDIAIQPRNDTSVEDFNFTTGFLSQIPKSIKDLEPRPIADELTFLAINLIDLSKNIALRTAEILDTDGNLIFKVPIHSEDKVFYISVYDIPAPVHPFKIAVEGFNKNNREPFTKVNETIIEPLKDDIDLNFTCGFSSDVPKSFVDTSIQPTSGIPSHLAINLFEPTNEIIFTTAEVLDINDTVLSEVPIQVQDNFYISTDTVIPPNDKFKIAIKGVNKYNGKPIRKISETIIEPSNNTTDKEETDFTFSSGFSTDNGKVDELRELPPIADTPSRLTIDLMNPEMNIELTTAEVLDINDTVLFEVAIQSDDKTFYVSDIITLPNETFKLAVKGIDENNGLPVRNINETLFEPIPKPKTDFKFKHGFSSRVPKSFDETSREPTAGSPSLLAIDLMNPDKDIKLETAEVLDVNDNVLFEVPIHPSEDFYISDPITSPNKTFKVAIKGIDENNGMPVRKISDTEVEPRKYSRAPKIDKTLTELRLNPKSTHKLKCPLLEGYPEPTISWYYKVHGSTEYVKLKHAGKEIKIVANAKTDLYRCNADNEYGHDYKDIKIYVNYKPKFISPRTGRNSKMEVFKGEVVSLPCNYRGQPKPTSKWTKDGMDIKSGTHYMIQTDHTLKFTAESNDSGIYKCIASNDLGSRSISINVQVFDPQLSNPL